MKDNIPNDCDEVGYGKPPKHTRFPKGQSGNPNGRPKKKKSVKDLFEDVWQTEVKVNGAKMTKAELFITQLVNDGIKGKASARHLLMAHLPQTQDELEDFEPSLDDKIEMIKTVRRIEKQKPNKPKEGES
ncbi:MAG: DUF5681 domain-containing protein [Verrucomicrobiota bacterium]